MKVVAFYNPKSGSGTTSLVYHLAHMFARLGVPTLAVDLDPQGDLTDLLLPEARRFALTAPGAPVTLAGLLQKGLFEQPAPMLPHVERVAYADGKAPLHLLPAGSRLALVEEALSAELLLSAQDGDARLKADVARLRRALWDFTFDAAQSVRAQVVLLDVPPGLGVLSQLALLSAHGFVLPVHASSTTAALRPVPLALFTGRWAQRWRERSAQDGTHDLPGPPERTQPLGYAVLSAVLGRKAQPAPLPQLLSYWQRMYASAILGEPMPADADAPPPDGTSLPEDPHRLGVLRYLGALLPLAQEERKPVFDLKPADGAMGSLSAAAVDSFREHRALALRIAERCGLEVPGASARTPTGQDEG